MNVLKAMEETLELARGANLNEQTSDIYETDYAHLEWMYNEFMNNEPMFSEGKRNRWLGWMQACVVNNSCGSIRLEEMKAINERNK